MRALEAQEMRLVETYEELLKRVFERIKEYYGERLFSVVLFGSVARGTPGRIQTLTSSSWPSPFPREG